MANINIAYQWAINACNAPNIGYSQAYRNQQNVGGITYYDCSSFIYYALIAGGFALDPSAWPFTTYTMGPLLSELGFVRYDPSTTPWVSGDILVVNSSSAQHTEMCYQGYRTMGAHTDGVPLADQVSINSYNTTPSFFQDLYRYGGGASDAYNWIYGNRYLSESEMQNNSYIIYSILYYGWSLNAIAGMLGNMQVESTINPGIWQNLDEGNYSLGFGLVQWTPATNYTEWAEVKGYEITDGNGQIEWIQTETPNGQWIPTEEYPMTWSEYINSTESAEYLAEVFLKNFERAGVEKLDERKENAKYWYNWLYGKEPINPNVSKRKQKTPIYMFLRNYGRR